MDANRMVEMEPMKEKVMRKVLRRVPWSARAPILMKTNACRNTETEMQYSENEAVSSHRDPTWTSHYLEINRPMFDTF